MIRRSVLLLPVAALALTCAACTSSGGGVSDSTAPASGTSSSSRSSAPSSSAEATPITQPKSVPASVPNASGAIKDKLVSLTSCKAITGGWQASGTAKPRSAKTSYTVTVFFTTNSATVQAFGQTKVSVPKGKTADWSVTSKFAAAPGTICVLRGAG